MFSSFTVRLLTRLHTPSHIDEGDINERWNLPQIIFFGDETSTKNVVDSSTFCGLPASFSIIYSPSCMLSPSLRVATVELDEKQLGSDLVPLFTYSTPTQKKIGKNDINYDQNTEVTIHLQ